MEYWQYKQREALSLASKIILTRKRIKEYYRKLNGKVYVAFSGGRDSTVLLDIVRSVYPNVVAVFNDTGLEYPEIKQFVEATPNVIKLKPAKSFYQVIQEYGYPVISKENAQKIAEIRNTKSSKLRDKRMNGDSKGNGKLPEKWKFMLQAPFKISDRCCHILKKNPVKKFERETGLSGIVGTMASDSRLRKTSYLKSGCISYGKRNMCQPISFWTQEDIKQYIKEKGLKISPIYSKGYESTGCIFCAFGCHTFNKDKNNKFALMKHTHPQLYKYCMEQLGLNEVFKFMGVSI